MYTLVICIIGYPVLALVCYTVDKALGFPIADALGWDHA
jgi:hypothetical protein